MGLLIGQSYIVYEQIFLAQGIDRPADICPVVNLYAFWTWIRRILSAEEWPGGHVGAVADMVLVV
jgi:hypothetical protein